MAARSQGSRLGALVFALAVVVVAGYVVVWLPEQARQRPVTAEEQALFDQRAEATNDRLQSMIGDRLSATQLAEERQREESRIGRELALRCLQWTDLHSSQPSDNTEKFQEFACKRYNHFVTTGELLEDLPAPEEELL